MTIPGFSAEASLHKTSKCYTLVAHETQESDSQAIIPQQQCPPWLVRTKTACPLGGIFGLWCRDYCGETQPISGWYPCGICFGGDI
jgi:hypothetical protein